MKDYYKKHRNEWKKGGKYYYYKPKEHVYEVTIKRGCYILEFD